MDYVSLMSYRLKLLSPPLKNKLSNAIVVYISLGGHKQHAKYHRVSSLDGFCSFLDRQFGSSWRVVFLYDSKTREYIGNVYPV